MLLLCLSFTALADDVEQEIKRTDNESHRLMISDCVKSFLVWTRHRVSEDDEENLKRAGLLAMEGMIDNNPFEIQVQIHSFAMHMMWSNAVKSPNFLEVIKKLLIASENDPFSLQPYNMDVKLAYERFLGHQRLMRKEDPLFDKALACMAIEDASLYFLKHQAPSLFKLFSRYDEEFRCGLAEKRHLNGKFLNPPKYIQ